MAPLAHTRRCGLPATVGVRHREGLPVSLRNQQKLVANLWFVNTDPIVGIPERHQVNSTRTPQTVKPARLFLSSLSEDMPLPGW